MNYWYLLAAIPVFGLLVFVHELGHFLTAKWAGIRVEEFGLGLPPRIVGIRRRPGGGWELIWFNGGTQPSQPAAAQTADDLWTPSAPGSGTIAGEREGSSMAVAPPSSTIYSLNLLPIGGFVRMPGENGEMYDEYGRYDPQSFASKSAGKRLIVLVAGVAMNFLLAILLFSIAYSVGEPVIPPVIAKVAPGSPAAAVGLRPGDTFLSVNGQPVQQFSDVQNIVQQAIAQAHGQATVPVHVVIRHAGDSQPVALTINVRVNPPPGQGPMGIERGNEVRYVTYPLWQAPLKGITQTFSVTGQFISSIVQMVTGAVKPEIAGPVGIVQMTGEVAQTVPTIGWWPILTLTGILSLNLAIINILPFPALDGGRVLLIFIELLRGGKRLRPEREGLINLVGMAILLMLIVVVTISDVVNWSAR
ncbi:MAG: site-2 protease family protein [Thermogemmatispora sp.]|jgi:regulator of sigma E protease|uniref:M50 family metallopeptidase n=1 Tax=Thermogemmatispora sp. TaxID=1968838 RepID=UPI0019E0770B|nr:M50 family metallopeptidase [Thermogemmatispora sp.]MBE3565497.1 site-2 protease family protein [Thermogemmatispora sp.]